MESATLGAWLPAPAANEPRYASTSPKPRNSATHCCGLPFVWRKKWARDWEQVRYYSERCRSGTGQSKQPKQPMQASA